jgi:uncharacterized membrane protein
MRSWPTLLLLALLLAVAARAATVYPELPARMASHFDAAGRADGWSSKGGFLVLTALILALVAAIGIGLPLWLARFPVAWINLPNRDYWLAPERSAATRLVIRNYMTWFGVATAAFVGWVLELTYRANLAGAAAPEEVRLSGHMWTALAIYLAVVGVWLALFVGRFRRAPAGPRMADGAGRK